MQDLTEGDLWEDEAFRESPHKKEEGYVFVDPHILCNPAIGDIDGDGHDELVVAVSYFYDREYYDDVVRFSSVVWRGCFCKGVLQRSCATPRTALLTATVTVS